MRCLLNGLLATSPTAPFLRVSSSPIALPNLIEYLLRLPPRVPQGGGIFDAGGPEVLSYEALMRQFGELVGVGLQQICKTVHRPVTHHWRKAGPTPVIKSSTSSSYGAVHIAVRGIDDPTNFLTGGRILDSECCIVAR
jgi:hypothetical protein